MIEAALMLPLFLFGILFFIWLGLLLNAKISLESGVADAVRSASTRGVREIVGAVIIGDINNVALPAFGGNGQAPSARLKQLLIRGVPEADGMAYYNDRFSAGGFGPAFELTLWDFPPEYIYSLIFAYESLRVSMGDQIRYPCSPALTNPDGGECLKCMFVHPVGVEWDEFDANEQYRFVDPNGNIMPPPRRRISLQCEYRPANFIFTPLVAMLRLIGGNFDAGIVLRKSALMEVTSM